MENEVLVNQYSQQFRILHRAPPMDLSELTQCEHQGMLESFHEEALAMEWSFKVQDRPFQ